MLGGMGGEGWGEAKGLMGCDGESLAGLPFAEDTLWQSHARSFEALNHVAWLPLSRVLVLRRYGGSIASNAVLITSGLASPLECFFFGAYRYELLY